MLHPDVWQLAQGIDSRDLAQLLVETTQKHLELRNKPHLSMQALNGVSQIEAPFGVRTASADAAPAGSAAVASAELETPQLPGSSVLDDIFTPERMKVILKGPPPRDT